MTRISIFHDWNSGTGGTLPVPLFHLVIFQIANSQLDVFLEKSALTFSVS